MPDCCSQNVLKLCLGFVKLGDYYTGLFSSFFSKCINRVFIQLTNTVFTSNLPQLNLQNNCLIGNFYTYSTVPINTTTKYINYY